jgi:hypothetical protein
MTYVRNSFITKRRHVEHLVSVEFGTGARLLKNDLSRVSDCAVLKAVVEEQLGQTFLRFVEEQEIGSEVE